MKQGMMTCNHGMEVDVVVNKNKEKVTVRVV